jgi:hypothetical protein
MKNIVLFLIVTVLMGFTGCAKTIFNAKNVNDVREIQQFVDASVSVKKGVNVNGRSYEEITFDDSRFFRMRGNFAIHKPFSVIELTGYRDAKYMIKVSLRDKSGESRTVFFVFKTLSKKTLKELESANTVIIEGVYQGEKRIDMSSIVGSGVYGLTFGLCQIVSAR